MVDHLLNLDAVEVHRGSIDVFDTIVRTVGLCPDSASGWGAFADDFTRGVVDDVFGGAMDDDDAGEIMVVKGDFTAGRDYNFHDANATVFKHGGVTFGSGFEFMVRVVGAR